MAPPSRGELARRRHNQGAGYMTSQTPRPLDPKVVTAAELRARDPDTGKFIAKPEPSMIPEMSAGLAQALLDASAEAWKVDAATTLAERLSSAVEFGDRI